MVREWDPLKRLNWKERRSKTYSCSWPTLYIISVLSKEHSKQLGVNFKGTQKATDTHSRDMIDLRSD